jgi:hypothetical protein
LGCAEVETKLQRNLLVILFSLLLVIFFSACGNRKETDSVTAPASVKPPSISISNALSELDAVVAPKGVDPIVFANVKAALREALLSRKARKLTCTPPTGTVNSVHDFTMTAAGGGTYDLTWHYINVGDYNQDGTVGIADITPLAMHYGEGWAIGGENTLQAVVDGSGNGTVDISDVTPIAMNFGVVCAGYRIGEATTEDWATHSSVATVPFADGTGEDAGRMAFTYNFTPETSHYYWVAPVDAGDAEGVESNSTGMIYGEIEDNDTAPTATVMPAFPFVGLLGSLGDNPPDYVGYDGDDVDWYSFTASVGDELVFELEYDTNTVTLTMQLYDKDGNYITAPTDTASPMYLYYAVSSGINATYYLRVLTLSAGYSDYRLSGVREGAVPTAVLTATPSSGAAPLNVDFDATGSSAEAIAEYAWDFEGDGTYTPGTATEEREYETDGWHVVGLRITDEEGLTAYDRVTVTVGDSGYDEMEDNDTADPDQANVLFDLPEGDFLGSLGTAPSGYQGYDGDRVDLYKYSAPGFLTTVTITFLTDTVTDTYAGIWSGTDFSEAPLDEVSNTNPLVLSYTDMFPGDKYLLISAGGGYADYTLEIVTM